VVPAARNPLNFLRTLARDLPVRLPKQAEEKIETLRRILDRRERWIKVDSLRKYVGAKSRAFLEELLDWSDPKDSESNWEKLYGAHMVEVSLDASSPDFGTLQKIPWEFLISSGIQGYRAEKSALIIRHLKTSTGRPVAEIRRSSPKFQVIQSLPGSAAHDDGYDDESLQIEQENMQESLGLTDDHPLVNPTLKEVSTAVAKRQPQILHLIGVDPTQNARLGAGEFSLFERQPPGMMLRDEDGNFYPALSEPLAQALCAGKAKPELVSFNFLYSASLGAAAVRAGARAALCFEGEISDSIAEIFFCNFYLAYRLSLEWRIFDAFRVAWEKLVEKQRMQVQGTGIILWSRDSLLDGEKQYLKKSSATARKKISPSELANRFDAFVEEPAKIAKNKNPLEFVIAPWSALNYSILHNNRSPFETFVIWKEKTWGRIEGISIEVVLHVGQERTPYNATNSMDYVYWLVHDEVRLALTSALARSLHESVYTTIFVRVQYAGKVLYEQTHRVNLLPIDQWQDDEANRQWLPSFVLPRDPAVPRIIDGAQKYMALLADDYGAGFDGYQGEADDVDDRVRGIWWTLTQDMPISYIAPPPTFVNLAQRLRSPSEILAGHRGTCVDLALLLASCLESVDLYPVIFLLEGHAFAGYYRSEDCYLGVREWAIQESKSSSEIWLMGEDFYERLVELVREGELVPLETVGLTQRKGFWESVEQGGLNLRSKSSFQFMVDIKLARECGVTPLPL
jgi:hypothetical protein